MALINMKFVIMSSVRNFATSDGNLWDSVHGLALKNVEIDGMMVSFCADHSRSLGIPYYDIRVAAHLDTAFLGVKIEDLGRCGTGNVDKAVSRHLAIVHALLPNHAHSVLDAVHAVRDLTEIVFSKGLLVGVECAVVGAGEVEEAAGEHVDQSAGRGGVHS